MEHIKVKRIHSGLLADQLVAVTPTAEPQSESTFRINHVHASYEEMITYPYYVTEENLEEVQKNWKKTKVQVGDLISSWDKGGWTTLSGRAGEHLIRDEKILEIRLTRMS